MRASQFSNYVSITLLLASFTASAGTIGFDPGLEPETQIHHINTFSPNGKDPLVRVSKLTGLKEYAAIGKIKTLQPVPWPNGKGGFLQAEGVQATGFLISPCLVMTTYHSVFGFSTTPNKTDFSVEFTANRTVIGRPIGWRKRIDFNEIGKDWVIVKLDEKDCLGAEVGFIKMLEEPFSKLTNPSLIMAGFPWKKKSKTVADHLWVHQNCNALESPSGLIYQDTIFNDCATSAGQSGSPLLVRNNAGEIRFVGMQAIELGNVDKTYPKFDYQNANVGVYLTLALTLRELDLIEADLTRPNPPR